MLLEASAAFVLVATAAAATTPPALPPRCTGDADCAHAGTCSAATGTCSCRHPWTGPGCAALALAPMDPAASGLRLAHNWTWGGSVIRGEDGRYHMFAMHLVRHCGIQCYQTNGEVLHATAARPEGPFEVEGVAIAPRPGQWDADTLSEPAVYRAPDGTYLLFHMGLNDTRPEPFDCMTHDTACRGIGGVRKIGVAFSKSLDGPWERLPAPLLGPNPDGGLLNCDHHDVSNPVVAFTPNGSVIMAFKGEGSVKGSGCTSGVIGFATAPHWRGPYTRPFSTVEGSGPQKLGARACEDPYIWYDKLAQVYRMLTHACLQPGMGGHLWSVDGLTWREAFTDNNTWAYGAVVQLANGSTQTFARRERPQVLLDAAGNFQCLYNAAQPCAAMWGDACHSYTIAQCVAPPVLAPRLPLKSDHGGVAGQAMPPTTTATTTPPATTTTTSTPTVTATLPPFTDPTLPLNTR